MKLLVKDHTTSLEEALRLVSPIFSLLPHAISFMGPHPIFLQKSKLTLPETQILSNFYFILTNGADQTIEDRLKRVEGEMLKLVSSADPGKGDQRVSLFASEVTYNDVRRLLQDKILNNKELQGVPLAALVPQTYGLIPQGSIQQV